MQHWKPCLSALSLPPCSSSTRLSWLPATCRAAPRSSPHARQPAAASVAAATAVSAVAAVAAAVPPTAALTLQHRWEEPNRVAASGRGWTGHKVLLAHAPMLQLLPCYTKLMAWASSSSSSSSGNSSSSENISRSNETGNPGSSCKAAGSDDNMDSKTSSCRLSQHEPHLVMHAARDIASGEAVTVTYMGPQMLQPVDVRRMHLQRPFSHRTSSQCPLIGHALP
mmetsp:Transcript_10598/g.29027  ORF Transcript_10598/g.29027 Transcript_10598/m.29027 type:complete len:224 (+) Transcript_10598:244-915(+)